RLLVVHSPERGQVGYSRALATEPIVIGREPTAQPCLVLRHGQVSRGHARIEPSADGGRYRICDLGSRNGTFVNGRRVAESELRDGDVIRIGNGLLLFQFLDLQACERVLDPAAPEGRIVGQGHAIARVRDAIAAAPLTAPTLIVGETGAGKELVALAIHEHSGRPGAFVPVNCSALPSNLVESELFGHVRGAFTGAEPRKGLIGRAERGTLFLDEIGEIGVEAQAKLLRAVALGEVRQVGSDSGRNVDVGIVAATNADLEAAVAQGRFRADLYARLMSHIIAVPPLRARREDVLPLCRHFLASAGNFEITTDAAEALLAYDWPYNVRELEQMLAPIIARVAQNGVLELRDLPPRLRERLQDRFEPTPAGDSRAVALLGIRRDATPTPEELRRVVAVYQGNVAQVATFFRKDRRQIYRWAHAAGLDIKSARDDAGALTLPPRTSPGEFDSE
ncbi:MAG: sigma 54-interacting transcriptional regulator, partial [Polyangiales bacterium]